MTLLIIYAVVIGGLFLYMQRRGANRRRQQQDQTTNLVTGAEVRTIGGLLGTVVEVDDDSVTIETTPGVRLRFVKNAIAGITSTPSVFDAPAGTGLAEGAEDETEDEAPAAEIESAQEGDAADSSDDNVPAGESVLSASEKK